MSRLAVSAVALCCLLVANWSEAQLAVEILDNPQSVYSFEPVYVTFEVRNEGVDPVVIPADNCPLGGAFLEAGRKGGRLRSHSHFSLCSGHRLVLLPPGGRWLFFQYVELGDEGDFEVQAVLKGSDPCEGRLIHATGGMHAAPTQPVGRDPRLDDCWSGEERSERIRVVVEVPTSEADRAAAEFMGIDHVTSRTTLLLFLGDLHRRFPESHYAYAASHVAGGGLLSMLNVVVLQPDNPLNPWLAAAMHEGLLYRNRPCASPKPWGTSAPSDVEERFARVIAAYPLQEPVQAYLRQLESELAAEECPDAAPDGDSGSEPEGSGSRSIGRTEGHDG